MITVNVLFQTSLEPSVRKLAPLLKRAVRNAAARKKGAVSLVLVGDAEIKRLNKNFLAHKRHTDAIAFNHPGDAFIPPGETPPFGDIFVCLPTARRQAKRMGHSLETELLILATHGALHLAGMYDATPALRRAMNRKTVSLLKKLA